MISDTERGLAERACERLLHRYAFCQDTGDLDGFLALFARDAEWLRPGRPSIKGHDAVVEQARSMLDRGSPDTVTVHALSNIIVDVEPDGTSATASSYSLAYQARDESGRGAAPIGLPVGVMRYLNAFRRESEGWRITRHESIYLFRP